MTPQDLDKYRELFPRWGAEQLQHCHRVALCSPNLAQVEIIQSLWPQAFVLTLPINRWNLNSKCPYDNVDLVVACNVFHYSPDPARWFANVFASCRVFWIQDLIDRRRGRSELGHDGDAIRYSFEERVVPYPTFNLSVFDDRLIEKHTYQAGESAALKNFIAAYRGDL